MFTEERHDQIFNTLRTRKKATVQELSEALFVSPATIRRDLARMERTGLIKRSHGGAVLFESFTDESASSVRENEHIREKKRIAELALSFIRSNSVLFMDSSSTVGTVIPFLSQFKYLTVITNGVKNSLLLSEKTDAKIYLPGGIVNSRSTSVIGSDTVEYLTRINAELALLSCSGIHLSNGVTDASYEQATVKRILFKNARLKVLLCDSSKFDLTFMCRTCGFEEIDYLLTDKLPPKPYLDAISAAGCEVLVPEG